MITCPYCRMMMADAPQLAGMVVTCVQCRGQFQVPNGYPQPIATIPPQLIAAAAPMPQPVAATPIPTTPAQAFAPVSAATSASSAQSPYRRRTNDNTILVVCGVVAVTLLIGVIVLLPQLGFSSSPRLDASSERAWKSSMSRVRNSLNAAEETQFDKALSSIMAADSGSRADHQVTVSKLHKKLDGKTGLEVISMGKAAEKLVRQK